MTLVQAKSVKKSLSEDQERVLEVLSLNMVEPSGYFVGEERGNGMFIGLPYKKIMEKSGLSVEKTLLSLGGLEAKGLVQHHPAIRRQTIGYHGRSNVEITGQKIVRIFSLTEDGKKSFPNLLK